ncbi:MAG: hypothetical protein KKG59_04550 [Nanoarchaeota archaeon]|nr:hypothetical protein [Nanoarchaeota archaeon]
MKRVLISILLVLMLFQTIGFVEAKKGSITLLTVAEGKEGSKGGTANLLLEITPGDGRIFIDSLPLSKMDTQISIRFGQEWACHFLDVDCTKYDFFYTIRADSSVVSGPSAGGAITVLTISLLGDYPLKQDIVMTGTINSGGLIGPVSGIKEKALAAKDAGYTTILVPEFELPKPLAMINLTNSTNQTANGTNIAEPDDLDGISIIKVSAIEDALYYFTGRPFNNETIGEIEIMSEYGKRMRGLAFDLCNRSQALNATMQESTNQTRLNSSNSKIINAQAALERDDYYSAASFCFSSGLILRELQLSNQTETQLKFLESKVLKAINGLNSAINTLELKTLSDLETYIIVVERLTESSDSLTEVDETVNGSSLNAETVAYAMERLNSAVSWARLFGMPGTPLELDKRYLKEACLKKISEAEERFNFVDLYVYGFSVSSQQALNRAYDDLNKGNYEACLFRASKAKAEANIILSGITIPKDQMDNYIERKLESTKKVIIRQ